MDDKDIAAVRAKLNEGRGSRRELSEEQKERREILENDIKVREQQQGTSR
jgi:hypothetical protein